MMEIFISWSGEQSKALAEVLRTWFPKVIQNLKPWISASDIEKGTRWLRDISERLEKTNFGIFCLTQENFNNPWILFEAGALSKVVDDSHVCPVLFGFEPTELVGPLSQFQATKLTKEDMHKLLQNMNSLLGDNALASSQLDESFEVWWPKLEKELENVSKTPINKIPTRNDRELLEEVLSTVRFIARNNDIYSETSSVLARLTPREEKVIRMRSGLGEMKKFNIGEIAEQFEIKEEAIEEIISNALNKLADPAFYRIRNFIFSKMYEDEI